MVPFVYLASVCRSLQCLISALTQAGGGGLLVRFAGSVALRGGRGTAYKCHWRVCGHLQCSGHTEFAPLTGVCSPRLRCSGYRLLYGEQALCRARFQFLGSPQKHRLGWACVLCLPARAAQAARSLTGALSLGAVRLIPSAVPASVSVSTNPVRACVCSGKLVSSCDPPSGCQPSRISGSL